MLHIGVLQSLSFSFWAGGRNRTQLAKRIGQANRWNGPLMKLTNRSPGSSPTQLQIRKVWNLFLAFARPPAVFYFVLFCFISLCIQSFMESELNVLCCPLIFWTTFCLCRNLGIFHFPTPHEKAATQTSVQYSGGRVCASCHFTCPGTSTIPLLVK